MKLLTYNTLSAHQGESFAAYPGYGDAASLAFDKRLPLLLAEIRRHDADVVCLQEVAADSREAFVRGLAPEYREVMYKRRPGSTTCGLLMLSRAGMGRESLFSCGNYPDSSQGYLSATFGDLTVVTTHLKAKPAHSALRLAQVRRLLDRYGVRDVVYAGDFNAEPDEACVQEMLRRGMKTASADAYTTCKRRDRRLVRQIDYVFVPADWRVEAASQPPALRSDDEVLPNARQGSDHVAVTATFART